MSFPISKFERNRGLLPVFVLCALVVLAYGPAVWLVNSWFRPGYDSPGALVFLVVASVFGWSASSRLQIASSANVSRRLPLTLLLLSFAVRLASQLLAIDVLGALMLVLDVYALGLLARLSDRERAACPLSLALLFFFALPLEPLLQRSIGFLLQQGSAQMACVALSLIADDVACFGVRITMGELDVLVDLPCSGARLLILLNLGFFALTSVAPLSRGLLLLGIGMTLTFAAVLNALRIVLLALGLYHGEALGFDVMQDPWHSGLGLGCAAAGLVGLGCWVRAVGRSSQIQGAWQQTERGRGRSGLGRSLADFGKAHSNRAMACTARDLVSGLVILAAAFVVVAQKPSPLDVSKPILAPELPISLAGATRQALPVSPQEQAYFTSYGGNAARAGYGPHSLLLVQTTSPLRHLHTPDVCFSGAGHDIRYVGVDFSAGGEAIYRSRSPQGEELRVGVIFHSSSGRTAHSISEVVWYWLREPEVIWTMIQTVSPWYESTPAESGVSLVSQRQFASGVRRFFNLAS